MASSLAIFSEHISFLFGDFQPSPELLLAFVAQNSGIFQLLSVISEANFSVNTFSLVSFGQFRRHSHFQQTLTNAAVEFMPPPQLRQPIELL
jgi:hypothetical protein